MIRTARTLRTSRQSRRSPLLQMALRLHKLYDRPHPCRPQRRLEGQVETVLYYSRLLSRQLQLLQHARCRGWAVAAVSLGPENDALRLDGTFSADMS